MIMGDMGLSVSLIYNFIMMEANNKTVFDKRLDIAWES